MGLDGTKPSGLKQTIHPVTAPVPLLLALVVPMAAQSPARDTAPVSQVHATLAQLMKGIVHPSSNVFFAAQSDNPADVPPAKDPSMATKSGRVPEFWHSGGRPSRSGP